MKKQTAFSLIEVLVVIAVVAILTSLALPSMEYMLLNNQITTKTNEFVSSLNYARSKAVAYNRNVIISPVQVDEGYDWGRGWRIWIDQNNDGVEAENESELIKVFEFPAKERVNINDVDNTPQITYQRGRGRAVEAMTQPIFFTICIREKDEYDPPGRQLRIERTGRISVEDRRYEDCPLG